MSYQTPLTISTVLDRIHRHDYVIPAIQREFVWSPDQMCRLFDSLLRKYPIGTFLFWQVPAEDSKQYAFYDVMKDYHELKDRHSRPITLPEGRDITAVLDGQQRLTSLSIGLVGSFAMKRRYVRSTASDAYPPKRMYLDLTYVPDPEDDLGAKYLFRFLTDDEAAPVEGGPSWFRAGTVLDMDSGKEIHKHIQQAGLGNHPTAYEALYSLWEAVTQARVISYYELGESRLDEVLDIFIRVNSGGTVLSKSDLLLSVATAQFTRRDARDAVHGLVDDLNAVGQGFSFSKDQVLKAGLVLTDRPDVRFTTMSFTAESMDSLDAAWDGIDHSLRVAVRLLASFGLSSKNLTAHSVLHPIADYVHFRGLGDDYVTAVNHAADRHLVRTWVIRTLLKPGIWGSGLDQFLVRLRKTIRMYGATRFPAAELEQDMEAGGRSLIIGTQQLDEITDSTYGQARSFLLLSLLYPGVDTRYEFHVDHVFPKSLFTDRQLSRAGIAGDDFDAMQDAVNRLGNLQLLPGPANTSKQAALPMDWAVSYYPDPAARGGYLAAHDMHDLPGDLTAFLSFYEARRTRMAARLDHLLRGTVLPESTPGDPTPVVPDWTPSAATPSPTREPAPRQSRPSGGRQRQHFGRDLGSVPNGPIEYRVRGIVHTARVENGQIILPSGERFNSPSTAALAVNGNTSVNGWRAWSRNGQTLADLHP